MRNQKVSADNVPQNNPVNKLRKEAPQTQAPVKPKGPNKQFQAGGGAAALKNIFMKAAKQRMK